MAVTIKLCSFKPDKNSGINVMSIGTISAIKFFIKCFFPLAYTSTGRNKMNSYLLQIAKEYKMYAGRNFLFKTQYSDAKIKNRP